MARIQAMMGRALRQFGRILRAAIVEWNEDNVYRMAAALAFYTLFSLTPIVLIAIAVAGFFVSRERAIEGLLTQVEFLVGTAGVDAVRFLMKNAPAREESRMATAIGIGTILFLATAVFTELKDALNTIWEVKPRPGLGIVDMIRSRFLSFALVLVIGFLLLVSLVASAALATMGEELQLLLSVPVSWLRVGNFVISMFVITVLFALIYRVLPDATVHFRDIWLGAAVTAVLFVVGKSLFGIYLGHSTIGSSYGVAGSLVIVVLWTYYSSLILLYGAEITQVQARLRGEKIEPTEEAVRVSEHDRVQQGIPHVEVVQRAAAREEREAEASEQSPRHGQAGDLTPGRARSRNAVILATIGFLAGWMLNERHPRG